MSNYNPIYRRFIDDKNVITPNKMTRGNFYIIKEYTYADGTKEKYTEITAPIIFTLFVSVSKDIIHCVKVSNVNPATIKRFFGKFINEKTERLQMKGASKDIYSKIVSKVPIITDDAYRTYNMTGINKVIKLTMDVNELTPKNKNVIGIDVKSQKKNL
jgi:hypothetical protein